jgi:hypothetical protein
MGVRQNRQPEEFRSFLSKTDYPGGTDAKNVIGGKNPFHRLSYRSPFLSMFWCRLRSVLSGFHLKDGKFGVFFWKIGCLEGLEGGEVLHLHHKYIRFFHARTMLNKYQCIEGCLQRCSSPFFDALKNALEILNLYF